MAQIIFATLQKYPSGSTSSDNDDDGALGSAHCVKGR